MATTRSRGCTAACTAPLSNAAPSSSGRSRSISLVFTCTVTLNAFVEERLDLVAHNAAEAFEDDLQEDAVVALLVLRQCLAEVVVVDPVTVDQTQLPAAVVVLETTHGFQGAVTAVVMLPATDHAPLGDDRPDDREVVLLDLVVVLDVVRAAWSAIVGVASCVPSACERVVAHRVVAVAVASIDDLVRVVFRLVVEHGATGAWPATVRIPVIFGVETPVAVEGKQVLQGVGRYVRLRVGTCTPVYAWHLHLTISEV